jgi:hypothetical protein
MVWCVNVCLSACTVVIPLLSAELMYLQSPHLKDAIDGT